MLDPTLRMLLARRLARVDRLYQQGVITFRLKCRWYAWILSEFTPRGEE